MNNVTNVVSVLGGKPQVWCDENGVSGEGSGCGHSAADSAEDIDTTNEHPHWERPIGQGKHASLRALWEPPRKSGMLLKDSGVSLFEVAENQPGDLLG